MIVDTEAKRTVLFLHQNDVGRPRASRRFNDSILQHAFSFLIYVLLVLERLSSQWLSNRLVVSGVDSVLNDVRSTNVTVVDG